MRQYYYSNNKLEDYTDEFCERLWNKGITDVICDFPEEVHDTKFAALLEINRINSYYRIKLYSQPRLEQIEIELIKARDLGFSGIALDCEAYSSSDVWYNREKYLYYMQLPELISKYFDLVIVFPEDFGGHKYELYQSFLDELNYRCEKVTLLLENTYEIWLPWRINFYYNRSKKVFDCAIGIWPESLSDFKFIGVPLEKKINDNIEKQNEKGILFWTKCFTLYKKSLWLRKILSFPCVVIQDIWTRRDKRFWYTETKKIPLI